MCIYIYVDILVHRLDQPLGALSYFTTSSTCMGRFWFVPLLLKDIEFRVLC